MSRRAGARDSLDRPTIYWDGVAREAAHAAPPLWRRQADEATSLLLDRWLPERPLGRVLKTDLYDESCTAGLVPVLGPRARFLLGIDVSPVVARTARARTPVVAAVADARALPFRAASFNAVVSNSTLDHFARPEEIARALRELERVLVPDGILILSLDNPLHPLVGLRNRLARLWRHLGVVPYEIGATHGPRGLRAALEASGFVVLEMAAVHHFPRLLLVAAERLLARRFTATVLGAARRSERLGSWPTRFVTGQYVAALARPARTAAAVARGAAA